jgi:hypothetical protein
MINLVLSVTKLNAVSICPKLYQYSEGLGKRPSITPTYFEEGELMHEGLRLYYTSIMDSIGDALDIPAMMRNYAAERLSLSSELVESTVKDFLMYHTYYNSGRSSWIIEAAEEPFAKVLYQSDDVTIVLNGKVDLRVKTMNGNGPRALVDHKYESQFREKLDRDNQALAYSWAYETYDWIYNRIGKQKSYKPEQKLLRPYFNFSKYQIAEWKEYAIDTAFEIIKYEKNDKFPIRFTGCNFQGHKCTFYDVCNTTPDNREYVLSQSFIGKDTKTVMER